MSEANRHPPIGPFADNGMDCGTVRKKRRSSAARRTSELMRSLRRLCFAHTRRARVRRYWKACCQL